jgi:hypothetical protein
MALMAQGLREGRIRWLHELTPIIAVAGLFADYLSPAELWTILLPLGCVVLLAALRKWTAAAIVLVLSSWVAIPTAAIAITAIETSAGELRLFALADDRGPLLDPASSDACRAGAIEVETLPIGPGQEHRDRRRSAQRDRDRPGSRSRPLPAERLTAPSA